MTENFDKYCEYCFTDDRLENLIYEDVVSSDLPKNMVIEFLNNYSSFEIQKFFWKDISRLTLNDLPGIGFTAVDGTAGEFVNGAIRAIVINFFVMRFCINYGNYTFKNLQN